MINPYGYFIPRNIDDLGQLITDGVPEGAHIEYKSIRMLNLNNDKLFMELSTDVGAFANAGGGIIVIGMEEEKGSRKPIQLTGTRDAKRNAEWLENGLITRLAPPIAGMEIFEVNLGDGEICIVLHVPMSYVGPHQSADKRFYARRLFRRDAMESFEIEDVRSRRERVRAKIKLTIEFRKKVFVNLSVENVGLSPVHNIDFQFDKECENLFDLEAPAFREGISYLNVGEKISYPIGIISQLFGHERLKSPTTIRVHFKDEAGQSNTETVVFDLSNHDHSSFEESDIELLTDMLDRKINSNTKGIEKIGELINRHLGPLTTDTGLAVSSRSLEHLQFILRGEDGGVKWNARFLNARGLEEVLGIDIQVANKIERYIQFGQQQRAGTLEEQEWITSELVELIRSRLKLPEWVQ